jgi:mono/diheme cytochrome c family protein
MRARPVAVALAAAALAAGCGGDDDSGDRAATKASGRAAPADPGLRVWAAQGCGSCHALAAAGARGTFGPDLAQTLQGTPATVIRRGIVDPSVSASPGYATGMMPEDYARRMSGRELDQLVAFLVQGRR